MKYTLDSLFQVETALKEKFPAAKISSEQVIMTGEELDGMTEDLRRMFFGVLTISTGIYATLSNRGNEVIKMDPGSQIIECFSAVSFTDEAGAASAAKGQFRGAIITIQN